MAWALHGHCTCTAHQVRVYSRRWEALKTGAVLVDAPGTHDSDSARGAVVKLALKEADSVWIVSNINRAVNDRSAKDLLGESFKRTLLMDGAYGRLIFVATQSDVLQRSEVVRALKLDAGSSREGSSFLSSMFNKKDVSEGGPKPALLDPFKNLVIGSARCFPTSPEEEVRGAGVKLKQKQRTAYAHN